MKKKAVRIISLALSALFLLCSCQENTQPAQTIYNGNFGGIQFDTADTVQSALPIPEIIKTNNSEITENTTVTTETTETSVTTSVSTVASTPEETTTTSGTSETVKSSEKTTTTAQTTTTISETTAKKTTTTEKTTITTTATTTTSTSKTTATTPENTEPTVSAPSGEVRGVWISYLEVSTLLRNKTEAEFKSAVGKIYDNCKLLGLNTVYVHARAFGDAFYDSDIFPFTKYISGEIGVKVSYDPYKILVAEAKKRGLSFHAWINPLRLCTAEDMKLIKSGFRIRDWYDNPDLKGKYIVNVNGTWYLNPAYDETIQLVCDGVKEILNRYEVDGIHIDDYFYPTTDSSFDYSAFSKSGYSSLAAFRINNCNRLVKAIYDSVHNSSSTAVFGASTQGSFENNLNQLYADAEAWCKGGYVDYFAPQIYYGFNNSAQPFEKCTDTWVNLVKGTNVELYIGLAVYKIGAEDTWAGNGKYEWCNTDTMLKRQTEYARKKGCDGIVLYSYNYLFTNGYVTNTINKELANLKPLLK